MIRILLIALAAIAFTTSVFADDLTDETIAEERAALHDYIDGLRDTYDADTDGDFRDYVAENAAADGVDLPSEAPRGGGDRPERGSSEDGAESGEDADRPSRGEGPARGEGSSDADRPSRG